MPLVVRHAILNTSYLIKMSTPSIDSASSPVFLTAPSVLAKLPTICHQLVTWQLAVFFEVLLLIKKLLTV
jgi:hypothetical protein